MRIIVRAPGGRQVAFPGNPVVKRVGRRSQHVLATDYRYEAEVGVEPGRILCFGQEILAARVRPLIG
jgi:hypothetical protein